MGGGEGGGREDALDTLVRFCCPVTPLAATMLRRDTVDGPVVAAISLLFGTLTGVFV